MWPKRLIWKMVIFIQNQKIILKLYFKNDFLSFRTAETQFRNVRNQYSSEKRKLKETNKSGAGAKNVNVRLSEIFPYLRWLEPYFVERQTSTNFQSQMHLEDEQEEERDGDDNISLASSDVYSNSGSFEVTLAVKQFDTIISKVTWRTPFTKQKRKLPEPDEDVDFMNELKEKLNSKKDDDQLYGDLLGTKLRRLLSSSKLRAIYEIDNIMFKYILQNEGDQQANVQAAARDQFTSPPPTPSTPIQANSPVYHQSYQQTSYQ